MREGVAGDDVDAEAALDDGGHEGGAGHGVVGAEVQAQLLLRQCADGGVFEVREEEGVGRGADGGEAFEELARGVVEAHRGLPLANLRDGGAEVDDGVVGARAGAVAAGALGRDEEGAGDFLGGGDADVGDFAADFVDASAFVEGVFAGNLVPVLGNKEINADVGGAFLAGLREEDDVAVEGDFVAVEEEEDFEEGGSHAFVVECAATVDPAVLHNAGEGLDGPLVALDADDIRVAHEQQGLFLAVALEPGDEAAACGFEGEDFAGDTFAVEDGFEELRAAGLVAGWVDGVHADEGGEVGDGFREGGGEVGLRERRGAQRGEHDCEEREEEEPFHKWKVGEW